MLHFVEKGRGDVLLLVHAFPLDHTMWQSQLDFFSDRYRVITPDVIGFGDSRPAHRWTIAEMGEELLSLLDHLFIEKCVLAGLSMGGYISLPFAAANPDRVEKLVLAHTRARADTDAERAARNDMIEALDSEGIRILPARMLPRLLGPNASPQAQQFVKDAIQRTGIQAAIHAVSAMRDRPDATARLAQISCPALVIAGDADAIMKIEDAEAMAAGMPQGRLAVIPNSGHLSNLEEPELFNRTLAEFLDFGPLSRVES